MASEMAARIGARIRERRNALGMNQRQLADALNEPTIDNQRVSDWERGVNRPSDRYMEKLAVVLEREVAWFYEREHDEPTPDLMGVVNGDTSQLDRIEANQRAILEMLAALIKSAAGEALAPGDLLDTLPPALRPGDEDQRQAG